MCKKYVQKKKQKMNITIKLIDPWLHSESKIN